MKWACYSGFSVGGSDSAQIFWYVMPGPILGAKVAKAEIWWKQSLMVPNHYFTPLNDP